MSGMLSPELKQRLSVWREVRDALGLAEICFIAWLPKVVKHLAIRAFCVTTWCRRQAILRRFRMTALTGIHVTVMESPSIGV